MNEIKNGSGVLWLNGASQAQMNFYPTAMRLVMFYLLNVEKLSVRRA